MQLQQKRWLVEISFLLAAIGISAVSSGAAALHPTLTVHCATGPLNFQTIQAAVNAAGGGYTITVCKGSYLENVSIDDGTKHGSPPLDTLDGLQIVANQGVQLKCPGAGSGFDVKAYFVTIQGFNIENCKYGISVEIGFSGENLSGNVIHNNVVGIKFFQHYAGNSVVDNEIYSNSGDGIFDSQLGEETSSIESIVDNYVHNNAGNGIEINSALCFAGTPCVFISDNDVENNVADGVLVSSSGPIEILSNTLSKNGNNGLSLGSTGKSLIAGNSADQNGSGPSLNQNSGIYLDSTSSNNELEANRMEKNTNFDAVVDLNGTNSWGNDRCKNASPSTLCVSP